MMKIETSYQQLFLGIKVLKVQWRDGGRGVLTDFTSHLFHKKIAK